MKKTLSSGYERDRGPIQNDPDMAMAAPVLHV